MKTKIVLFALTGIFMSTLFSCKKNYECVCEKTAGGEEIVEIKNTKNKADEECEDLGDNNSAYFDCNLK